MSVFMTTGRAEVSWLVSFDCKVWSKNDRDTLKPYLGILGTSGSIISGQKIQSYFFGFDDVIPDRTFFVSWWAWTTSVTLTLHYRVKSRDIIVKGLSRDWQDYTRNPGIWASVIFWQKIQMCLGTSGSVISGQKIQSELLNPDLGIF